MDRARNQGFSGARFSGDQHWKIGVHQARHHAIEPLHRLGSSNERQLIGSLILFRPCRCGASSGLYGTGRPLHQIRQIEGFGQVIVGGGLFRLDRRHDGVLGRDHYHRQPRAIRRDLRQHLKPVTVWHHHISDHRIAFAL